MRFDEGLLEVPTGAQVEQRCLGSARMQVRSLAWHSGLKDLAFPQLQAQIQSLACELLYAVGVAIK